MSIASNIASSSRRHVFTAVRKPSGTAIISSHRNISSSSPRRNSELETTTTNITPPPIDAASTKQSRVQPLNFPTLTPLARPRGIHVASLHLAAHHSYPLDLMTTFSLHAAHSLGIPTSNSASLPTTTSLYTVPKSPFVHKKSQENFERKTHRRLIKVWDAEKEVIDLWLRYIRKNGLGGVGMRAEVFEWVQPGQVGRELKELGEKMERKGEAEIKQVAEGLEKEFKGDQQAEEVKAEEKGESVDVKAD